MSTPSAVSKAAGAGPWLLWEQAGIGVVQGCGQVLAVGQGWACEVTGMVGLAQGWGLVLGRWEGSTCPRGGTSSESCRDSHFPQAEPLPAE